MIKKEQFFICNWFTFRSPHLSILRGSTSWEFRLWKCLDKALITTHPQIGHPVESIGSGGEGPIPQWAPSPPDPAEQIYCLSWGSSIGSGQPPPPRSPGKYGLELCNCILLITMMHMRWMTIFETLTMLSFPIVFDTLNSVRAKSPRKCETR